MRCANGGTKNPTAGWDLYDGFDKLLDLRFTNDILLLLEKSVHDAMVLLQSLMRELRQAGLLLNASKTKVLTTEAQPPSRLFIPGTELWKKQTQLSGAVTLMGVLNALLFVEALRHRWEGYRRPSTFAVPWRDS